MIWGLLLQFGLGLFILRWPTGFQACKWLGDQVTTFLGYTDEGSKFVFGEKYTYHPVVFVVCQFIFFFNSSSSYSSSSSYPPPPSSSFTECRGYCSD